MFCFLTSSSKEDPTTRTYLCFSPSFGLFRFHTGIAYLVPEALGSAENYILLRWMDAPVKNTFAPQDSEESSKSKLTRKAPGICQ